MKLKLNKKKLKNLSKDQNVIPAGMTPQIGGGAHKESQEPPCGTLNCQPGGVTGPFVCAIPTNGC